MARKKTSVTSKFLRKKLLDLINLSGLEIEAFAELTHISESHVRSLLNGKKEFTPAIVDRISDPFNLNAQDFSNKRYSFTLRNVNSQALKNFYTKNKKSATYFIENKELRKASLFIENKLIRKEQFFRRPVYVSEVREKCSELGKKFSSKKISQILNYFVEIKKLKRKEDYLILKDGSRGQRVVSLFYR
jgi:plasmid maintenance system antidote protein VapI